MELTSGCLEFNEAVQQELSELRTHGLKGVVLSAMWITMFKDQEEGLFRRVLSASSSPSARRPTMRRRRSMKIVSKLVSEGLRVLIVAPTWIMPHRVPQCLVRHGNEECSAERAAIEVKRKPALAALKKDRIGAPGKRAHMGSDR